MQQNPYESPRDIKGLERVSADPLRGPSIACLIVSTLAICGSVVGFVLSLRFLMLMREFERPEFERDAFEGIWASVFWFLLGISGLVVAHSMRHRHRKWLIVVWAIVASATCVLSPLGLIVLMRLWRTDVWNSFNRPLISSSAAPQAE